MIEKYNIVIEQEKSTVVAKYEAKPYDQTGYQSEAQLEKALIAQLQEQGYEYAPIKDEQALIQNLRGQLEKLNGITFTDAEWKRLFDKEIAGENLTIEDKTQIIQRDYVRNITLDSGETKNIRLIDKKNIHNNHLQVINQYEPEGGKAKNRYDVTILVNGLPLVHIELKRRGVSIREAFNQINRYQRESFWAGRALFDYVQIFVISNGTHSKYYSNTTRFAKEKEFDSEHKMHKKVESNSFEFTSWWSDAENRQVPDLRDFTTTFFAKHTLLNILTKYCVYTVDRQLLVMRPYQIAATERILLRIQTALNNRWQGSTQAGGYIWHTTGSGKTLTSFKTAQLASRIDGIEKVLFVVDRQDLDYQTMKEYDNFEKDSANGNSNFHVLLRQLNDPNCHIIITTIQKLSSLLKRKCDEVKVLDKNVVMIFDECHRSQFGEMHDIITRRFKKYLIFGFTGTPIFALNAGKGVGYYKTTAQAFGGELDEKGNHTRALHTYTIINAINDRNVLRFHIDYISTMKAKAAIADEEVWGIEEEGALHAKERYAKVVEYILSHFGQKTKRSEQYGHKILLNVSEVAKKQNADKKLHKAPVQGFNSILAADSVESAMAYYAEFKKQMSELPPEKRLKIATIFTFAANEEEPEGFVPDEDPEGFDSLDQTAKEFLSGAIDDYNSQFGTSYTLGGDSFGNYYKDISLRMKNKDIDLLIVVGMFLTGFDAKTLNTLWVDKPLKMHGLLQAYSRTNRILNSVKDSGNIVCFRNLEKQTNDALALFGDKDASGLIILRSFAEYYNGYTDKAGKYHPGYRELIERLTAEYPVGGLKDIESEEQKREFVRLFGALLRFQNLLSTFDAFLPEDEAERLAIQGMTELDRQDYTSWYQDLREEFFPKHPVEKSDIVEDLEFEMELVKQVQVSIDYILLLVQKFHESHCQDQEIVVKIRKAVDSSPDLRDKKELIERFISRMTPTDDGDIYEEWSSFVRGQKAAELEQIIEEEHLKPEATREFVDRAFADGYVTETGTAIAGILPPVPLFGPAAQKRAETKLRVLDRLKSFFQKFFGLV